MQYFFSGLSIFVQLKLKMFIHVHNCRCLCVVQVWNMQQMYYMYIIFSAKQKSTVKDALPSRFDQEIRQKLYAEKQVMTVTGLLKLYNKHSETHLYRFVYS